MQMKNWNPLCKEGMDYCVSTPDKKYTFESFAQSFFFRERGDNNKLKKQVEKACGFHIDIKSQNKCNEAKNVNIIDQGQLLSQTSGKKRKFDPICIKDESIIDEDITLVSYNTPKVKYMIQRETDSLIVLSFASVMAEAGFYEAAEDMMNHFSSMDKIFELNDYNLKLIFKHAKVLLPSWLTGFRLKIRKV